MKGRLKYFIVFLTLTLNLNAQSFYELPFYFGQFYNDPLIDQSSILKDDKTNFILGHRRNSNNFGGVNTSIAGISHRLKSDNTKGFNLLSINFLNDNEGFLISRNRAYLGYARHTKINENYFLAGGLTLGFYNFAIKPDDTFSGASDAAIDGNLKIKFYSNSFQILLTANQIFNSTVQPIEQKTILTRHYNFVIKKNFKISDQIESNNDLLLRWSKETQNVNSGIIFGIHTELLFIKTVLVGATYEYKKGIYYSVGIKEIPGLKINAGLEISYLVPSLNSQVTNLNQFEITIHYKLKN